MTKNQRISTLSQLGNILRENALNAPEFLLRIPSKNPWYTLENVQQQLATFGQLLTENTLNEWASTVSDEPSNKTVALILAGNLPLVGFHDILSALISGMTAQIKPSSDDAGLTSWVLEELCAIAPEMKSQIQWVEKLADFDMVIATGSNNSARYFEYYFGQKPHIIRKNRNSIAVLTGQETSEELHALGHDIFDFFGMGCRSVSTLFVPQGYDFTPFFESIQPFAALANHHKYHNNYEYHKSIYLINGDQHFDNGFLVVKKDEKLSSPLAVVHYQEYTELEDVKRYIDAQRDQLQCIVSTKALTDHAQMYYEFGQSQYPSLDDYADGVNTLAFLQENR